jgi:hypothetical protein
MGLFEAFLLFKIFGGGGRSTEPGQGGITKQLTLKGHDGRRFLMTFFGDKTRRVETDLVDFFVKPPALSKPIKVLKGNSAEIADAIANFPE